MSYIKYFIINKDEILLRTKPPKHNKICKKADLIGESLTKSVKTYEYKQPIYYIFDH